MICTKSVLKKTPMKLLLKWTLCLELDFAVSNERPSYAGHYRSKKPELIEFSNHNFYNDQLRMLPDRKLVNNKQAAIEYIKVKGVWEKQANLM
jgi:hypothetical protein